MLELIQITNDPELARRCDALQGMRLFVDLEWMGKAERQAGRNTFLSAHQVEDVGRIKAVLTRSALMVRVNPLHARSAEEIAAALGEGADSLMLPMFSDPDEVRRFCDLVAGRVPVVALLETAAALHRIDEWVGTPGLAEVFVGLNDLHASLRQRFMFEPLAHGAVERVGRIAHARALRFGFGGIARMDEGLLPGRDVLAEHLRLRSQAVILSRTFRRDDGDEAFVREVAALRATESALATRSAQLVEQDRVRIAARITGIAAELPAP